jgi:hypothetical protein
MEEGAVHAEPGPRARWTAVSNVSVPIPWPLCFEFSLAMPCQLPYHPAFGTVGVGDMPDHASIDLLAGSPY